MMTTTTQRPSAHGPADRTPREALAGTGTLIVMILRRERVKLPAWLLGSTALLLFFALVVLPELAAAEKGLQDLRRLMEGGVGSVFGPGYGRDAITEERYLTGVYGLFFFILAALMSLQLVARHTRLEEQHGRVELIRASVLGRHAQLTATLVVAVAANLVLGLLLAAGMVAAGHGAGGALLFGAGVAAVGLVFTGITTLTVQVTEHSRTATGLAGAILGAAWAIRAAGDLIEDHGSPLSWLSPLAWSNQTRPYVDGRWWPLLLSLGLAVLTAAAGYALSARRDVGAGLLPPRPGAGAAAPWLSSPLAVVFRLQRAGLIWWTVALGGFGLVFGGLADQMADPTDMSESRLEMFGGSTDTLVDGYLAMITVVTAAVAGVMVVLGVLSAQSEETKGRAEPLLATATGRVTWLGSYVAVTAAGLMGLLLVVGLATGAGAALTTGDGSYVGEMTGAFLAHAPGALVLLGLTALLVGVLPRLAGVMWLVLGYNFFAGVVAQIADLPQGARAISPLEHTGQPPLESVSWPTLLVLLAIAVTLTFVGLAGFRRRDLEA
ncbi:ABC transporter permease, partial [Nocardioides sp.]|uniref:ABC transporter permease n=1 Tax=Nocardioides sp. TaxID=35761 RepID=UPI002735FB2D